jgi:hypothetical protein
VIDIPNELAGFTTLMMEAISSSETVVNIKQNTQHSDPKGSRLYPHDRNMKAILYEEQNVLNA